MKNKIRLTVLKGDLVKVCESYYSWGRTCGQIGLVLTCVPNELNYLIDVMWDDGSINSIRHRGVEVISES